jgi:hypothetical protein
LGALILAIILLFCLQNKLADQYKVARIATKN